MKKLITIMAIGIAFFNNASSQFSVGAGVGAFNFTDGVSESLGGFNISGGYALNEKMTIGLNVGNYWKSVDFLGISLTSFVRPVTVSFKNDFMEDAFRVYAGAELGLIAFGASFDGESESESYLGLGAIGGVKYLINDNINVFGEAKYQYIMLDNASEGAVLFNIGLNYTF
jgi:hypothetical protein